MQFYDDWATTSNHKPAARRMKLGDEVVLEVACFLLTGVLVGYVERTLDADQGPRWVVRLDDSFIWEKNGQRLEIDRLVVHPNHIKSVVSA